MLRHILLILAVRLKRIENDIECPIYMLESNNYYQSIERTSRERRLENDRVVINSGFPTVNCRK